MPGLTLENKKRGLSGPRGFYLYIVYIIKLEGVNRTFFGLYIWFRKIGLGGIGVFWGLDRNFGDFAVLGLFDRFPSSRVF